MTVDVLVGKTLTKVEKELGSNFHNDRLTFTVDDGTVFVMEHDQECCEEVYLEDICGDLQDLVGSPILTAEDSSNKPEMNEYPEKNPDGGEYSFTWTFYRITTAKGLVVLRWFGSSNGYYSEEVDFYKSE